MQSGLLSAVLNHDFAEFERHLALPTANSDSRDNQALVLSIVEEQLSMTERLLELDHVGVGMFQKEAIFEAAALGNRRIFERLLSKPGAVLEQRLLNRAARLGHLWLVEFLLKSPMIRAGFGANEALKSAVQGRHLPIIDRLLQEPEVFEKAYLTVKDAASCGNVWMVDYLLKKSIRVDNEIIRQPIMYDHVAVLDRLLSDARNFQVNPEWVSEASSRAHLIVLERLLRLPDVASHILHQANPSQSIRDACALSLCFLHESPISYLAYSKHLLIHDYQTAFLTSYWIFKESYSAPSFVVPLIYEYVWQGPLAREVVRISSQMRELLEMLRKNKKIQ